MLIWVPRKLEDGRKPTTTTARILADDLADGTNALTSIMLAWRMTRAFPATIGLFTVHGTVTATDCSEKEPLGKWEATDRLDQDSAIENSLE